MLRLFFHVRNQYLRVRLPLPQEDFDHAITWKNKIQFKYTDDDKYTMAWASLLPDLESADAYALVELVGSRYPVSKDFSELKKICPELAFPTDAEEWIFYGGTFNPWHQGHQACLNLVPQDKICFVLPDMNPHKDLRDIDPPHHVLELITRIRFGKKQYLIPSFLLDKIKNPTVDWIEKLKAEYPTKKLSLLLGFDSFSHLKSWTRSQDLLKNLSTIYVVSRLENEGMREDALSYVKSVSQNLDVIFLGRHEFENLSSTVLRKK